jgi:hypothetical protein
LGSPHVGDSVRVHRHEIRNRCRYALVDSRGSRTLVHDLGPLELAEGRAPSRSSPEPFIRRYRLAASRLEMSATGAEPIAVRLSPIRKRRETLAQRAPLSSQIARRLADSLPCSLRGSGDPPLQPVWRPAQKVYFAGAGAGVSSSSPVSSTSTAEPGMKS